MCMFDVNVLVVGAGPIGIELAAALKHEGVDYQHVEAGQIGSTMQWWAPGTVFFSSPERIAIAGVPLDTPDQSKASRERYLSYLRAVVDQFDLNIQTYTRVSQLKHMQTGGFEVDLVPSTQGVGGQATQKNQPAKPVRTIRAQRVVLAIGDMHKPKLISVPGEDLPHVSHYLDEPHIYFRKRILIVGGKNSAAEAAIRLYRAGCDVTLSYRGRELDNKRIKYWILPELQWLIDKDRIRFEPGTLPTAIKPGQTMLKRCDETGQVAKHSDSIPVDADFVLLLTGYEQDQTLFVQAGVELVGASEGKPGSRPCLDRSTMMTGVDGLYVIGTASAGTQAGGVKVFIETSHVHVDRVVASIMGRPAPKLGQGDEVSLPES